MALRLAVSSVGNRRGGIGRVPRAPPPNRVWGTLEVTQSDFARRTSLALGDWSATIDVNESGLRKRGGPRSWFSWGMGLGLEIRTAPLRLSYRARYFGKFGRRQKNRVKF